MSNTINKYENKVICISCGSTSIDDPIDVDSRNLTDVCSYEINGEYVAECGHCSVIISRDSFKELEESGKFFLD